MRLSSLLHVFVNNVCVSSDVEGITRVVSQGFGATTDGCDSTKLCPSRAWRQSAI